MLSATIQGQVPVGAAWGVALDWLANTRPQKQVMPAETGSPDDGRFAVSDRS